MRAAVEPHQQARQDILPHWPLKTERFVHRDPRHHAWVVPVALDGGRELVEQPLLSFGSVRMEVGHFGPDQKSKAIGPVQPAGIFDFLVLTGAVEPKRLRKLDVPAQVGIRAGGVPAAGKIPLIEDEALDVGLAV